MTVTIETAIVKSSKTLQMYFTKIITQNYFTSMDATYLHTRTLYNVVIMYIHNDKGPIAL